MWFSSLGCPKHHTTTDRGLSVKSFANHNLEVGHSFSGTDKTTAMLPHPPPCLFLPGKNPEGTQCTNRPFRNIFKSVQLTAWKEATRNRLFFSEHLSGGGGWSARMAGKWRNPGGRMGLWTRVPLPWASQVVLVVKKKKKKKKHLPMQETWVQSLGWEDPMKEDMATCCPKGTGASKENENRT